MSIYDMLGKTIVAMADERKEPCIHCGKVWFAIHHYDGMCHVCRDAGLQGRTEIFKKQQRNSRLMQIIGLGFVVFLVWAIVC